MTFTIHRAVLLAVLCTAAGCAQLGGGFGDFSSGNLIWIIHSASESGYR